MKFGWGGTFLAGGGVFEPLEKTPRSLSAGTGKAFLSSDYDSRRYLDTACVVRSSEWWVSPMVCERATKQIRDGSSGVEQWRNDGRH